MRSALRRTTLGVVASIAQIPVFMLNAAVMGLIWGLLRSSSGSMLVSSISHGLWNGGAYVLFGYGTTLGALGIHETAIYGPEVGFRDWD